jgi:bifunctional non-homologous end joining protein LigD
VPDKLSTYRGMRDPARTPEPVPPPGPLPRGDDDTFVVQEHHARQLHWDFRLERNGVLVSWAVPKNLPLDPKRNNLAVHTEDHPLEYASFTGEIPAGEYGGGRVTIWDRGTYELEKWSDDEVKVVLRGSRVSGRYVLFKTGYGGDDRNWMVHRMDPPQDPDWQPLPELVRPMLAVPGQLPPPAEDERWGYEMKWDGVRAVVYVEGGRVRVLSRNDRDVTGTYPELRALGPALGSRQCVLDGEIVAFDAEGRASFGALQPRMHVTNPNQIRRLTEQVPVVYLIFDVLHLEGRSTLDRPYRERRELLESLELAGPSWQTPPYFPGAGAAALDMSRQARLEGVVAKRLGSRYEPGRRSADWLKVKSFRTQEVVVIGWKPGSGRREGGIGSLLLAANAPPGGGAGDGSGPAGGAAAGGTPGLVYAGKVGTGFTQHMLAEAERRLRPLERATAPAAGVPRDVARDAHWVEPRLVGEVAFAEWTRDGRLRAPSWRGWREDKEPGEVIREEP